jgi:hypothetical protein
MRAWRASDVAGSIPDEPGVARAGIEPDASLEGERRRRFDPGRAGSGEGRNRTGDTTIFSRVLYRLSYLARQRDGSGGRLLNMA